MEGARENIKSLVARHHFELLSQHRLACQRRVSSSVRRRNPIFGQGDVKSRFSSPSSEPQGESDYLRYFEIVGAEPAWSRCTRRSSGSKQGK
jgi:hypothetical protein